MDPGSVSVSTESLAQRFSITKQLAKSPSCTVYSAQAVATGELVAIKKIDKAGLSASALTARRLSEVEIPSGFLHDSLLHPITHYEDEKSLHVVLELCEGGDLKQYLEAKKILAEQEVCALTREVALGLEALHDSLVVHRNLSLSAVLLTGDGHAVIDK